MLDDKYKLPLDRYKFDAPYFGYSLCCGQRPKVDFDSSLPNAKYNVGHMACLACNKQLGVISNGGGELPDRVGFLYNRWNEEFPSNPVYSMPDGYNFYEVNIEYLPHGSKVSCFKHFVILKLDGKKVYNYCLHRDRIIELEFPKSNNGAFFIKGNKTIHFGAYNYKWKKKLEDLFLISLEPKPWGFYD